MRYHRGGLVRLHVRFDLNEGHIVEHHLILLHCLLIKDLGGDVFGRYVNEVMFVFAEVENFKGAGVLAINFQLSLHADHALYG